MNGALVIADMDDSKWPSLQVEDSLKGIMGAFGNKHSEEAGEAIGRFAEARL